MSLILSSINLTLYNVIDIAHKIGIDIFYLYNYTHIILYNIYPV